MLPVRNERLGGTSGPDYVIQSSLTARNKARRFLEENFEIVSRPWSETGWLLGSDTQLKIP